MAQLNGMQNEYDVVVIGSGPAGATTARYAAQSGLRVLLVDKKQELGAPIQCSGAVSAHALENAEVTPAALFVESAIHGFRVYDESGQFREIDYRRDKPEEYAHNPLGYVVDRRRFDRHLLGLAEQAGAESRLKTEALGYRPIDARRVAVRLRSFGGEVAVAARVIVGADGLQSQVGKWAGLATQIKLSELASCLQYIVEGVPTEGLLEIITGHRWAPGGYAWLFPKCPGLAEVGLGVIRTLTEKDARRHLDDFIRQSFLAPRLKNLRVLEVQGGGVPLAAPLKRQYADHLILVGDAARHVNPITGGGIHTALRCGRIAGEFLGEILRAGKPPTAAVLGQYQQRWSAALGKDMWRLYQMKRLIFRQEIPRRNAQLFDALANYFSPQSEFRKI